MRARGDAPAPSPVRVLSCYISHCISPHACMRTRAHPWAAFQRKMLDLQLSAALVGYARLSHITAALNVSAKRIGF